MRTREHLTEAEVERLNNAPSATQMSRIAAAPIGYQDLTNCWTKINA